MIPNLARLKYNPLLLVFDESSPLSGKIYEDLSFGMFFGLLFLIASNVFMAYTAFRYRRTQETSRTKIFMIIMCVMGVFEFYFRGMIYSIHGTQMGDYLSHHLLPGVMLRSALQGVLFFAFFICVLKRAKQEPIRVITTTSSLESELNELESLKEKDLISDEEYATKRSSILS